MRKYLKHDLRGKTSLIPSELLFFFSFIDPRPVTSWYFSAARGCLWIFVHAGDAGNTDLFWLSDAALGGFQCTYWERTCAPQKINVLQAKAVKIKHAQLNIYNTTKLSDTHRQNVVDKSKILTLQFQLTSATFWVFVWEEWGVSTHIAASRHASSP